MERFSFYFIWSNTQ